MYTILLYFSAAMPCPGHGQRREKRRGALSASFFRNSFQVRSGLKWWRGNINDNKPQRNPPAQWRNAMPSSVLPATVISDGHPNRHHHHNPHPHPPSNHSNSTKVHNRVQFRSCYNSSSWKIVVDPVVSAHFRNFIPSHSHPMRTFHPLGTPTIQLRAAASK